MRLRTGAAIATRLWESEVAMGAFSRILLIGVSWLALSGVGCVRAGRADVVADKPLNILLIVADDMRADALGVSGNPDIHTPALDQFARESVYFTGATAHVAQCCPWRAMLLTGLAPHQSGYISMDIQQGRRGERDGFDDLPTLPGLLRDAGYRTVLVGKWHIRPDPWRCGFTEVMRWLPEGMGPYSDPVLCCGPSREERKSPGFVAEIFTDDAVGFLNRTDTAERPFFLMLAATAPHEPCEPTPDRIGALYAGKTSEDLVRPGIDKGASARWKDKWLPYYRAVTHLDEQVQRVLDAIEARGLASSTVVIFTSDSGIMMGRRGIDSKVAPYEDSVRVPLIIRDPRAGGAARRSAAPVSSLDLPPTILSIAGVHKPEAWAGRDLSSLVAGGPAHGFRDAVCEWIDDSSDLWGKYAFRSIFDGRYKLIVWAKPGRVPELYDVERDPYEERDLAGDPAERPRVADLEARLRAWLARTGDSAAEWAVLK